MTPETQDLQIIEREFSVLQSRRERILALRVTDDASLVVMAEALREGKRYIRDMQEFWRPLKADADRSHKTIVAREKMMLAPGEEIVTHAGSEVASYQAEQERLRREAEAVAERERLRLEEEAREAMDAEARRLRREAEDAIVDAAATAEANGDLATAERILAQPVIVPTPTPVVTFTPPVRMPVPTKVEGLGSRDGGFDVRLVSLDDVICEAAAGRAPKNLLMLNEVAARAYAKSTGGMVKVRGLEFIPKRITTMRLG